MTTHGTGTAERRLPRGRQSRSAWLNVAALLAATLTWPAPTRAQVVEYYHHDALGSIRAVSNQAGQIISYHVYLPYGEELNPQPDPQPLRFTGKERDTETGLDYFGARYYGARIGRFTSVDPLYTWTANLVDPQRWNRYAYVRGNPLRFIDPDGRYTCTGAECARFEAERQAALKSGDSRVVRSASAFGDPGVDNGATVTFGAPGAGRNGVVTHGLEPSGDGVRVTAAVVMKSGLRGTSLREVLAHEGSHVADGQAFGATIQGTSYDASRNLTDYETEAQAYLVTNAVLASANTKADYGKCGSGRCILGAGIAAPVVARTIDQLLADPANGYGVSPSSPGSKLFPGLQ